MTVRAIVWMGDDSFEMREFDEPAPGAGEMLVRVSAATVCGSDRHTVSGRRFGPHPSVLGHEGVGVIAAVGPGAVYVDGSAAAIGHRVVWSVTAPCLECDRCAAGRTAKCRRVLKTGHEPLDGPWPLSGTYATHMIIRRNQAVVPVPGSVADGPAATAACAGATVMAALEAAGGVGGRAVLVTGAGMLGLIAVAAAAAAGARFIEVRDPAPDRHRLALECGANLAAEPGLPGGAGDPRRFDVALEFSGSTGAVEECLAGLDIGGVAVLVGSVSPSAGVTVDPESLVRGWHTITGVHNYEPRHLDRAVAFLAAHGGKLPWGEMLSGPTRLDGVAEVFRTPAPSLREVIVM